MKEGKALGDTMRLAGATQGAMIGDPGMTGTGFSRGIESGWSTRGGDSDSTPRDKTEARARPASFETENSTGNRKANPQTGFAATRQPVPKLKKKSLVISGKVPKVLSLKRNGEQKSRGAELAPERKPTPIEAPPQMETAPVANTRRPAGNIAGVFPVVVEAPKTVPEIPAHVEVKVIPTPKKRAPKVVEEVEEQAPQVEAKPLKVIRKRRGEENPTVFETEPKSCVPEAMLAGIKPQTPQFELAE